MALIDRIREKYIYLVVLALLLLLAYILLMLQAGAIAPEYARVYVESLVAIATLALLYFAYFNATSKRLGDIAQLELAVRPILVWELASDGSRAVLSYKTIKHPIYDFKATLRSGGKRLAIEERHLDVSESNPGAERKRDVTAFVGECLGKDGARTLEVTFAYHSEASGRYELLFTKEMRRSGKGFAFDHRNFVSAKYPWREGTVVFDSCD
ncbi:MAG: hypothetical protein NTX79_02715 [Candidatus Micrarchaeota archaeon]|nr:hypothetical protein [Candidatus Micrarchaeota archaeon]